MKKTTKIILVILIAIVTIVVGIFLGYLLFKLVNPGVV